MIQSITQYDLMSTSTCTPIGGGASQCVYQYRKEVSTTTQNQATTTMNYEIVGMTTSLLFLFILIVFVVTKIVEKLT